MFGARGHCAAGGGSGQFAGSCLQAQAGVGSRARFCWEAHLFFTLTTLASLVRGVLPPPSLTRVTAVGSQTGGLGMLIFALVYQFPHSCR